MFLEFYGLNEQPFGVTPDPRFICPSRTHSKAFNSLSCGIEAGCGFLALIAKPGMGKTTLVFQLLKQLEQTSRAIFLFQTQCDSRELLRYLLSGLGLDAAGQDIVTMHEKLNQLLARELLADRRFVLIIDECHNLDNSVLETVRLLSDFETPSAKLMQILLVGQTQLAEKLSRPSLTQLRQRISILSRLEPLTRAETVGYIEHRLQVAGYRGGPLFTTGALESILAHSEGIPRNVNNLCFNALLVGYAAGRKQIDSTVVDQVLADLDMNPLERSCLVTQEPLALTRAPISPYSSVFKTELDPKQVDSNDAREVVVECEVTPPQPMPQVPQAPPPPQRPPLSYVSIARGDLSDRNQVDSGDGPKVASDLAPNPPVRKPEVTRPLAPPQKAQSDPSTKRGDFSEGTQVASTRMDQIIGALSDAIYLYLGEKLSQAGRPTAPAPHRTSVLSDPPVRKPQITPPLPPLQKAQSGPSTSRCDFSVPKQVASSHVDQIALIDAIYPVQKSSQAGRPTAPAPQRTPVLSYPAVSRGSLACRAGGTLALGAALVLSGLLPLYSGGGAGRQLRDSPTPVVADIATPVPGPQDPSPPAAPSTPAIGAAMASATPVQSFLTRTLGLKIGSIVIDPGHGGQDTGTKGPTGLVEKDLCLDVALRLGRIIEQHLPGAEVIFTRTDDTFIPLEDRTNIANKMKADLFLSIHANWSRYNAARGVETYYLNLKGSREAMEVAARENATVLETVSDLQELVKEIARNEKIEESREFAEDIQDSLSLHVQRSAKSSRNRGVHRAPFVVLIGANMPSALAEISFLSNPSDEQLLKKGEYRQRLAEGLYQGVVSYLQRLNSVTYNLPARNLAAGRSGAGSTSGRPAMVEQFRNQQ